MSDKVTVPCSVFSVPVHQDSGLGAARQALALLLSFLHHADEVVSLLSSLARTVVQSISNRFGLGTKPGTSSLSSCIGWEELERNCSSRCPRNWGPELSSLEKELAQPCYEARIGRVKTL